MITPFTRRKALAIWSLLVFLSAFIGGLNLPSGNSGEKQKKKNPDSLPLGAKQPYTTAHALQKKDPFPASIVSFRQKLQGKPSLDTLKTLFDEAFLDPSGPEHFTQDDKRGMVTQKWGEIAPLQGLEKLEKTPEGTKWIPTLFSSWASKNPKAAIACYEEHYKAQETKLSSLILIAIAGEYAVQYPKQARDWLTTLKSNLPPTTWDQANRQILNAISRSHPDMIPEQIRTLSSSGSQTTLKKSENELYNAGVNWGMYNTQSREWIAKLPENIRAKAEAGRIMGITKGHVEKLNDQIRQLPPEEQLEATKELADRLRLHNAGLDMPAYTHWLMEALPEQEFSKNFNYTIRSWFITNKEESKTWINSLPPGKKKDLLLQWHKESRRNPITGEYTKD